MVFPVHLFFLHQAPLGSNTSAAVPFLVLNLSDVSVHFQAYRRLVAFVKAPIQMHIAEPLLCEYASASQDSDNQQVPANTFVSTHRLLLFLVPVHLPVFE